MTTSHRTASKVLFLAWSVMVCGCAGPRADHGGDPELQKYIDASQSAINASVDQAAGGPGGGITPAAYRPADPSSAASTSPSNRRVVFRNASDSRDPADDPPAPSGTVNHVQPTVADEHQAYPIDLANALAMGGANHLQIQMARQRVLQSYADLVQARSLWLPSLRFGVGWNKHDGRLQGTLGNVLEVSRNSLFVGGGAGLGFAPLAGGASGPFRMLMNLSLADAIFEPWVAARNYSAENATEAAVMNDSLAQIAVAYFSLVEARGLLANAREGLRASEEMVQLTSLFAREGAGSEAAVDLAKTEQAFWRQAVQENERQATARAAELARQLRIDPQAPLVPADENVVPIHLVDPLTPVDQLLAAGLAVRPELAQQASLVRAATERVFQEQWRPWLPSVIVGASAGTFGGGPSTTFSNQSGRSDIDLSAIWEVRNLGFGEFAQRRQRESQLVQSQQQAEWVRDQIATDIVTAANDVSSYLQQMDVAMQSTKAAAQSYQRNYQRVRNGEGLPIELLQAIRARVNALNAYTQAVADYNRAQANLLRAVGRPPSIPQDEIIEGELIETPEVGGQPAETAGRRIASAPASTVRSGPLPADLHGRLKLR